MIKAAITALLLMAPTASAEDALKEAAKLVIDKTQCGIYVPQASIDAKIMLGATGYQFTYEQSRYVMVGWAMALKNVIDETGGMQRYCQLRAH